MNCNRNSTRCGCSDVGLTTPCPSCSASTYTCPDANPCAENFSDNCIIHTGDDIVLSTIEFNEGDSASIIFQKLMILQAGGVPKSAPIGFKSIAITSSTISLSWILQLSTTAIKLSWGTTISMVNTQIDISDNATSYTLSSLSAGTTYYLQVEAGGHPGVIIRVTILTA